MPDLADWTTSTVQLQDNLGSFVVPLNGSNNSGSVALVAGTNAVALLVGSSGLNTLQVQGVQTGQNYLNLTASGMGAGLAGYFVSAVISAIDTQVKVTGTTGAAQGPTTVWMAGLHGVQAVFVFDNQREPAAAVITDTSGNPLGGSLFAGGQQPPANSLPVVPAVPTGTWTKTVVAVPNSGTATLLAANASRRGVVIDANQGSGVIGVGLDTSNAIVFLPVNGYWEMPSPITTAQLVILTTAVGQGGNIIVYEIT